MIVAIDSNVVLDIAIPRSPHARASRDALTAVLARDTVIISEPVLAEIAPAFASFDELDEFLSGNSIAFVPSTRHMLYAAGQAWRQYRMRSRRTACGKCGAVVHVECPACDEPIAVRRHILADFMIGAHALEYADALLTRDRRYYKTYFPKLPLI